MNPKYGTSKKDKVLLSPFEVPNEKAKKYLPLSVD